MPNYTTDDRPVLGLDADDTLWENEALFARAERRFHELMVPWTDHRSTKAALLATERAAVDRYGYGVKSFVLSMIRTAIQLSDGAVSSKEVSTIMNLGEEILDSPVELLPGVRDALEGLAADYRLLVITKGDAIHQMAKINGSGLLDLLWQVEIVGEKDEDAYHAVLARHGINPMGFTMIGNSVVSDVLPILALGGQAIHVPHHTTWELEVADPDAITTTEFPVLDTITDVPALLADWA